MMRSCGGVIDGLTTREELLARGFTEQGADEVLKFREYLKAKGKKHPMVDPSPGTPV